MMRIAALALIFAEAFAGPAAAGKTVIVNQYTRGLPPTRIPVGGGTVNFDHRFATNAKCGPFQHQDPNYGQ